MEMSKSEAIKHASVNEYFKSNKGFKRDSINESIS